MAHAYTPGLRVTDHARVLRERRLPLKGEVLAPIGAEVAPDSIVARTELPGNVQTVNLAQKLATDPAKVVETLVKPLGSSVRKGDIIATAKSMFGFMKSHAEAPADGTLESVSGVTGQLILREPPIPVEVTAYVRGRVVEVLTGEGVIIEAFGAFLQGIFGVGGETFGPIAVAVRGPEQELLAEYLTAAHRGKVVVGGSFVTYDTLQKARGIGVAAVVVGGFNDQDLKRLLGKDLGVAITGGEDIGFTLILTEGFGRIQMAERTWSLLTSHQGEIASVSGATQIRAGVMRPEILIPHAAANTGGIGESLEGGLDLGSVLRVIREPYFGRIGKVTSLPAELRMLDTEAHVRVLEVEFVDSGERVIVPRANVERIAD
ncbi:MAG: hypothetical protein ABIU54_01875 [Candidatus Eisenbacteria bacterium]